MEKLYKLVDKLNSAIVSLHFAAWPTPKNLGIDSILVLLRISLYKAEQSGMINMKYQNNRKLNILSELMHISKVGVRNGICPFSSGAPQNSDGNGDSPALTITNSTSSTLGPQAVIRRPPTSMCHRVVSSTQHSHSLGEFPIQILIKLNITLLWWL